MTVMTTSWVETSSGHLRVTSVFSPHLQIAPGESITSVAVRDCSPAFYSVRCRMLGVFKEQRAEALGCSRVSQGRVGGTGVKLQIPTPTDGDTMLMLLVTG
jgi:hypothetical protein